MCKFYILEQIDKPTSTDDSLKVKKENSRTIWRVIYVSLIFAKIERR